jgi:hypothetical protein
MFVVSCVHMPNVGAYRQFDCLRVELFGRRGATNPARVLLTCVFGNRALLVGRASGKQFADVMRKGLNIFRIEFLATFSRALPSPSTSLGVGQTFLFGTRKRLLFDQDTLPFVPSSRAAEPNHHCPECRVPDGASRERGVSTFKEHQMIEISAGQAERSLGLHAKKAPLPEFFATLRASRIAHDPEDHDLGTAGGDLPRLRNGASDSEICARC